MSAGNESLKVTLTRKVGPFPAYVWGGAGVALLALYIWHRRRVMAAAASQDGTGPQGATDGSLSSATGGAFTSQPLAIDLAGLPWGPQGIATATGDAGSGTPATLTQRQAAQANLTSDDPITAISAAYIYYLQRNPDPAGLAWWLNLVVTKQRTLAQAVADIAASKEAQAKFVSGLPAVTPTPSTLPRTTSGASVTSPSSVMAPSASAAGLPAQGGATISPGLIPTPPSASPANPASPTAGNATLGLLTTTAAASSPPAPVAPVGGIKAPQVANITAPKPTLGRVA